MANKRRLIDKTPLIHAIGDYMATNAYLNDTALDVLKLIARWVDEVPTVEVCFCKDCRWRGSENCAMFYRCDCGEQHTWETDNDFCSYGKTREVE